VASGSLRTVAAMKTIHAFDVAGNSKSFAAETPMPFAVTVTRLRKRTRESLPLSEIISLWFAISSPLIGLVIGFLGAWFVTWLTS
jgi:hypothetical protein